MSCHLDVQKVFTLPALKEPEGAAAAEHFFFHCPYNFDFPVGTNYEAKVTSSNHGQVLSISCLVEALQCGVVGSGGA